MLMGESEVSGRTGGCIWRRGENGTLAWVVLWVLWLVCLFVSGRWLMSSLVVAVEGMDLSNLMHLCTTLHGVVGVCMCMQVCM